MDNTTDVLQHPISLQLFLYCLENGDGVGIRQAQRELGITSSSSVHWYFNKLISAGLIYQEENNLYRLTEDGRSIKQVSLPVEEKFFVINYQLIPVVIFQMTFLFSSLIVGLIFVNTLPLFTVLFFILVIITELILLYRRYLQIKLNQQKITNQY